MTLSDISSPGYFPIYTEHTCYGPTVMLVPLLISHTNIVTFFFRSLSFSFFVHFLHFNLMVFHSFSIDGIKWYRSLYFGSKTICPPWRNISTKCKNLFPLYSFVPFAFIFSRFNFNFPPLFQFSGILPPAPFYIFYMFSFLFLFFPEMAPGLISLGVVSKTRCIFLWPIIISQLKIHAEFLRLARILLEM